MLCFLLPRYYWTSHGDSMIKLDGIVLHWFYNSGLKKPGVRRRALHCTAGHGMSANFYSSDIHFFRGWKLSSQFCTLERFSKILQTYSLFALFSPCYLSRSSCLEPTVLNMSIWRVVNDEMYGGNVFSSLQKQVQVSTHSMHKHHRVLNAALSKDQLWSSEKKLWVFQK